jgi:hypothetical protein
MNSLQNGNKNPSEPIENDNTGGTSFGKREETCSTVPSPPRVITKSIVLEYSSVSPVLNHSVPLGILKTEGMVTFSDVSMSSSTTIFT